ncbi:hypothetical protein PYW07_015077 [Mythimna separata]|uniref:Elongation of very long chain fatty acids protein n=1 Tax=Mythimna separata TaxID=271217 RepID=A0AAD7Z065_MYTSE|nr:hypothetical protein PYW07_015077 [Mythimna separata]
MVSILSYAWQGYKLLFEELPDPRTKGWLFVAKPYQTLALLGLYLMFVLKWGPKHMKNRQPYNLDAVLMLYNAFQIVSCTYLFYNSLYLAWGWDYKWICEPVDFSNEPKPLRIAQMVYFYFLLKLIDLLDTVFFVLRKKSNQVTFLHIYHHTGMCLLIWGAITYLPGGHGTLIGVINSFVHIVMYSYYLLSVAVPSFKNAIWIKKHVTQLQILQFFWCVVHMAIIVFKPDCEFPRWTSAVFLPQNLFMLLLFIDFYIKTYIKKPQEKLKEQMNAVKANNQNNDKSNDLNNEAINTKTENGFNKLNDKEFNDTKTYLKNDLNKFVNGSDVSHNNNNNEFCENINYSENCKEKSTCGSGKCKINCHKPYKSE